MTWVYTAAFGIGEACRSLHYPRSGEAKLPDYALASSGGLEKPAWRNDWRMITSSTAAWPAARILGLIGLVLYVATGVFPYLASGLVAPLWGIAVLYAGWLFGLWLTILLYRRRSVWALGMPVAALAFWWVVITLGESVFDWTA